MNGPCQNHQDLILDAALGQQALSPSLSEHIKSCRDCARFRRDLAPSRWGGPLVNRFVRTAVFGLLVAVALVVYIISQISTGKTFEDILGVGLAFDHTNFIMVVTNLILAMLMLSSRVSDACASASSWTSSSTRTPRRRVRS